LVAVVEAMAIVQKQRILWNKIVIKIIGGSSMFPQLKNNVFDIAYRNLEAVKQNLAKFNVEISGQDTGVHQGRIITFILETGEIQVYPAGGKRKVLL
jgi:chemotaxis receptor (MCP) glutamine deamidase CheD